MVLGSREDFEFITVFDNINHLRKLVYGTTKEAVEKYSKFKRECRISQARFQTR